MYIAVYLDSLQWVKSRLWKNVLKLQNEHWSKKQQHIFVLMVSQFCIRVLTVASSPAQPANGFGWSEMPSRAGATLSWVSCHSPKWAAKSIVTRHCHFTVSPEVLALNKINIRTRWDGGGMRREMRRHRRASLRVWKHPPYRGLTQG